LAEYPRVTDGRDACQQYQRWAKQEWAQIESTQPADSRSDDYASGFIQGFVDQVYAGGKAQAPPIPPRKYWRIGYRNPHGREAVENWYRGFQHGAQVAQEKGYRQQAIIPSSVLLNGPTQAVPEHGDPQLSTSGPLYLEEPTPTDASPESALPATSDPNTSLVPGSDEGLVPIPAGQALKQAVPGTLAPSILAQEDTPAESAQPPSAVLALENPRLPESASGTANDPAGGLAGIPTVAQAAYTEPWPSAEPDTIMQVPRLATAAHDELLRPSAEKMALPGAHVEAQVESSGAEANPLSLDQKRARLDTPTTREAETGLPATSAETIGPQEADGADPAPPPPWQSAVPATGSATAPPSDTDMAPPSEATTDAEFDPFRGTPFATTLAVPPLAGRPSRSTAAGDPAVSKPPKAPPLLSNPTTAAADAPAWHARNGLSSAPPPQSGAAGDVRKNAAASTPARRRAPSNMPPGWKPKTVGPEAAWKSKR
jgi:hypothetical protein